MNPGKRPFYKYATPETALAILESRAVRYSSPLSFNDPFDVQSGLHFDFPLEELHEKVIAKLGELAASPDRPTVDETDPMGQMVLLCHQHYGTHGFPFDRWREKTAPSFSHLVDEIRTTQQKLQQHWLNLLPGMRVFCVSEERDNLLMWAHYAKDHTGAVFEFWSLPENDNPLSVAGKVEYVTSPPPFFTESEWLANLLTQQRFDIQALSRRYVYFKSADWFYEHEWRVWYPLIPAPSACYVDMPIQPKEFAALYFGCRAKEAFVSKATHLAREAFPHLRVFRASRQQDTYTLVHTEVYPLAQSEHQETRS